jgi:hypothetical protein
VACIGTPRCVSPPPHDQGPEDRAGRAGVYRASDHGSGAKSVAKPWRCDPRSASRGTGMTGYQERSRKSAKNSRKRFCTRRETGRPAHHRRTGVRVGWLLEPVVCLSGWLRAARGSGGSERLGGRTDRGTGIDKGDGCSGDIPLFCGKLENLGHHASAARPPPVDPRYTRLCVAQTGRFGRPAASVQAEFEAQLLGRLGNPVSRAVGTQRRTYGAFSRLNVRRTTS